MCVCSWVLLLVLDVVIVTGVDLVVIVVGGGSVCHSSFCFCCCSWYCLMF